MNPELWHSISNVFLIVGIVFFVLTVWLSVKFHLISIIQSEINNRRERKNPDEENDYFIIRENKSDNSGNGINYNNGTGNMVSSLSNQEESVSSNTVLAPQQEESVSSNTVLAPQQGEPVSSNTILVSQQEEPVAGNTVFVSAESTDYEEHNNENDDFVISENIIVIHGDPSSIRRKVAL